MKDVNTETTMDLAGAIAITGMAGRFPGAGSMGEFWTAIREGRDLIRPHAADTLADNFTDAQRASDAYVPVRPAIDGADMFDAPFFGMNPREAAQMDPQFRVFLECCWQALEDAGLDPTRADGPVGVFGGASMSTYFLNNILHDRAAIEDFVSTYQLGDYQQFMGALGDTLATRVAFRLGLTGPAMTVSTACSTSLVAVAQACQALAAFQCDTALAGGVSITFPQERGYLYQEGGMVSRDGRCRPFDAEASGTVFGHGCGVVTLRRIEDALEDGDPIHAVIRGTGLNNDGSDKIAFTAPSVTGQAMAIAQAQGAAGIGPESIGYVECHGTGTPLGDPVEFEGLSQAFAGVAPGRTALGSVKANIGHCDAAAGVIGLMKATLALRHRVLPPMANYSAPNPMIALDGSPFRIEREATDWVEDGPRRAAVSALGVGGTNAHVILEEAPARAVRPPETEALHVLPLSARSDAALAAQAEALATRLEAADAPELRDVALTLQEGRRAFDYRRAVVARDTAGAIAALRASGRGTEAQADAPPVVFMFPGQGAQYPLMGATLYRDDPTFARILNAGSEILKPLLGLDLAALLYRDDPGAAARVLRDTRVTQPALYLVEYAIARLWQDRGVAPAAMIGHSVGEFVAATLAGVFSFETGLALIAARGRLMQDQPAGGMLSVRAGVDDLAGRVPAGIDLAARNAPKLTVYAGPDEAIDAFRADLEAQGIACTRLHTSHAFHSAMMDPVCAALEAEARTHDFAAPTIPYVSCVTGTWITTAEATDPAYWARHCRACVNFETAIRTLCADMPPALVEVGPGRTLGAFAAQSTGRGDRATILQSLPEHTDPEGDAPMLASAFGGLWAAGVPIDWAPMRDGDARRISLPTYPFEKSRHWVEPPVPLTRATPALAPTPLATETSPAMSAPVSAPADRTEALRDQVFAHLAYLSGDSFTAEDAGATFLELGFDSLLLGQLTQKLGRTWDVSLTFRQLMKDFPSVDALVTHLDQVLPQSPSQPEIEPAAEGAQAMPSVPPVPSAVTNDAAALMQAQTNAMLALFESQMRNLGQSGAPTAAPTQAAPERRGRAPVAASAEAGTSRHDLNRRAAAQAALTPAQQAFVDTLCAEYSTAYPTSKARAQEGRRALADPRTAAGFRPEWKELTFPVIAEEAKGAYLTDPDGNRFVDFVNGFGQTAFGHSPDFVTEAVAAQMGLGFAIGPQTPLAHEVAAKVRRVTGHDRVTFCNTGSEAVMAAMRLARTVTGRDTIVTFKGDYHGQFDEVLVKGRKAGDPTALPAVAGVPDHSVSNMVVLDYGSDAARDWIRDNIDEIAAVLVEPIQSRRPDLRPHDFCKEVREITQKASVALIFDEIVTGFRVARGGMAQVWEITPDMATYGKVVGGGMPVGVLAGSGRFLDALDGGHWSFGDDSQPEVAPTFFAGTFVRHPLVLAAMSAVLDHVEAAGDELYGRVADRTAAMKDAMNDALEARGLPRAVTGYASWMIVDLTSLDPRAALIYPLMRLGGIHVHDGYPWFATTAHAEEDFDRVVEVFEGALDRLQAVGILADPRVLPLTPPQKEIWMAAQMGDAASGVFIESVSLSLTGTLDAPALERALNDVIARHDALRLRFSPSGETARVMESVSVTAPPQDMTRAELDAVLAEDATTPFDLTEGPLIRARLARLGAEEHVLVLTTHHIVCDGWSTYLMIEDLAALYTAHAKGSEADLPAPVSFADYARGTGTEETPAATAAFWAETFPALPELPDLPTDRTRTGHRSFAGATHVHRIGKDVAQAVKTAAAGRGITLFAALSGTLAALVDRLAPGGDVVLAVPTAGQTALPDDRLVGHLVNLLPVPMALDRDATAADALSAVSARILDCFDHGDTTYGDIIQSLGARPDPTRQPLTEVQFNLDQQPDDFGFPGLQTDLASNPRAHTNFDLVVNVTEGGEGLRIDLTYATDILDAETVARWCAHYDALLSALPAHLDATLGTLPLMDASEEARIAALGTPETRSLPEPLRTDAMVSARAAATPDAIAVEDATGRHSYAEIDAASDRLAAELARRLPAGGRVAVLQDRSVTLVTSLLAVMKAGLTYVPMDPKHPAARRAAVLEAAEVGAILHLGDAPENAGAIPCIDAGGDYAADPALLSGRDTDAAYVIFTSGTTGTPKGVEVPHDALATLLLSMAERPGFGAGDTMLAVTTVAFDIAALELFLPLVTGGTLVLAREEDVRETFPIVSRLLKGDVTVMQATPTYWQMLLEAGMEPDADLKIMVGGEVLPRDLADALRGFGCELWNMYGPTETTIWSSCGQVGDGPIDIGTPTLNTAMHVLDGGDRLAPVGAVGELNIGGAGVATGYFNRPDLTEAAFRDVEIDGRTQRLYRTGDLARRMPDGSIRLLGRQDGQVKLRGFRIELGDIEAAMRSLPGVTGAAACLRDGPAGPMLAGFYVAGAELPDMAARLAERLPAYMVPTGLRRIDALPLTGSGKLDRRALPEVGAAPIRAAATPPATDLERDLLAIWQEVLGVDGIGTEDDLFELGADSLSIFRIAARTLDRDMGIEARHLMQHPTIKSVAAFAESRTGAAKAPSLKDFRRGAARTVEVAS
ncbi:non-ribosomal peptide synthetase/type I polyketide synthase [Jannaschia marina]|uniref:non-ribosomal peptide synthetase/type I polyketide synthase n=1 Tax=Jannaschia marina TaxID=2741674 RepID=UPI0015CEE226|nr:non-ribosomal peptide synthetase/type I polyketide synthase [Jannaschia marina]